MINDYKQHRIKCSFPNKNIIEELLIEESKQSLQGLVGKCIFEIRYKEFRKYLLYEYSSSMFK